jgi:hypothetical protein
MASNAIVERGAFFCQWIGENYPVVASGGRVKIGPEREKVCVHVQYVRRAHGVWAVARRHGFEVDSRGASTSPPS